MPTSQWTLQNAIAIKAQVEQHILGVIPFIPGDLVLQTIAQHMGGRIHSHNQERGWYMKIYKQYLLPLLGGGSLDTNHHHRIKHIPLEGAPVRACVWMWVHRFNRTFGMLRRNFPLLYCLREVTFCVLGRPVHWCIYSVLMLYLTQYLATCVAHPKPDERLIRRWCLLMDMGGEKRLPVIFDMVQAYVQTEGSPYRQLDERSHWKHCRLTPYLPVRIYKQFICDLNCRSPFGLNLRCSLTGRILPPSGKRWSSMDDRDILRVLGNNTFSSLDDVLNGVIQHYLHVTDLLRTRTFPGQDLVTHIIGQYLGVRYSLPIRPYYVRANMALVRRAASKAFGWESGFSMSAEAAICFLNQKSILQKVNTLMRTRVSRAIRFAKVQSSTNWVSFSSQLDALPLLLSAVFEHDPTQEDNFLVCLEDLRQSDSNESFRQQKPSARI
jgi:hypothetical protein